MDDLDKKVLRLCKMKKREGYELLFTKYKRYIYSICMKYTFSSDDSLDLVQEIYIKVYKSIDRIDERIGILPWVKRITVNTCLNYVRDKKETSLSLNYSTNNEDDGTTLEDLIQAKETTEDRVIFYDSKRELENSISKLPDEMRMVFILRTVKNMSYKEIVGVMNLPEGTVKTHIHKAKKRLKDDLKEKGIWG